MQKSEQQKSVEERKKRKREWFLIFLLVFFFLLLTFIELRITQLSKILPFVNSLFFFLLVNVNLLILIGLCWLIFRNVGKLLLERKQNILGARLKTKLVIAFFCFSIIPTVVLFTISALYINSSFDKWFSVKVQNTLQASLEITRSYYKTLSDSGIHFASQIAKAISDKALQKNQVRKVLSFQRALLLLDAVEFYPDEKADPVLVRKQTQEVYLVPPITGDLLRKTLKGEKLSVVHHLGAGDLIRCLVPRENAGVVVVSVYIPISLRTKVDAIVTIFDDYQDTSPLKVPMKSMYLIILIMVTLVILFVVVWMGLYLARELTEPVQKLVEGARLVGSGNLDVHIVALGNDEISVLVQSFNKMTQDLKENQRILLQTKKALEKRGAELEVILTSIGTGVFMIDQQQKIIACNPVAFSLLDLDTQMPILTKRFDAVFVEELLLIQERITKAFLRQEYESENVASQFHLTTKQSNRLLNIGVKPLKHLDQGLGVIVVIDDMTYMVKAQREVAWREVAKRIAHEIKNPLTPIQLSAQRLERRFAFLEGEQKNILQSCISMIVSQTDELKKMVNAFSRFARFPELLLTAQDLNLILEEVTSLFEQAHSDIVWTKNWDKSLPLIQLDRDQMKRAFINLYDNAVSAIAACSQKTGRVLTQTKYLEKLHLVQIEIGDNGIGMTEEIKASIFEPYFSTKGEGTGLGLAIVKRIIDDHNGVIRFKSDSQQGAHFFIELPTQRV
jgi:two-component system nitrogen regulation sensor histidine kinase NtrY